MHERTGRAIARLLFVLCCALPTLVTVGVILLTWTPWYHRRCLQGLERQLYRDTGLVVELDDFRRLAPGGYELTGVRLLEPELKQEVAKVRKVCWVREQNRIALRLYQPELRAAQLPRAWALVHDRFLCRPDLTDATTRFAADDLTIHSRHGASITLRDVDAWIRPLARAVDASIQCLPADAADEDQPLLIHVVRDRSGEIPTTRWRMQTGTTPLPCSALADYVPLFGRLGPAANFSGSLVWTTTESDWTVDLSGGRFDRVDLARLFETLPHRLSGDAEVRFERCVWKPGELVDISGEVRGEHGYIGQSLISGLNRYLGFGGPVADDGTASYPFEKLAMRFDLHAAQLRLSGICSTLEGYHHLRPETVMSVDGRELLLSPQGWMHSSRLMQAIAPPHSEWIPASQQTSGLLGLFLPPSRPLPLEAAPASARISRLENFGGGEAIRGPQ